MGLDIYVGTLTRYYQRDWLTAVQQAFPGKVEVVRPDGDNEQADPEEVREVVALWTQGLAAGLKLDALWGEDHEQPYFTDKPAWDGYGALLWWAAYDDQGIDPRARPASITTENCLDDPAFERYTDRRVETRYSQLLLGEEMWLPIPSPSVFGGVDVAGNSRMFGNCAKLLGQLNLLNERTWNVDIATGEALRREGCERGSGLEASARFGWAVMRHLAHGAVQHQLPMILDY